MGGPLRIPIFSLSGAYIAFFFMQTRKLIYGESWSKQGSCNQANGLSCLAAVLAVRKVARERPGRGRSGSTRPFHDTPAFPFPCGPKHHHHVALYTVYPATSASSRHQRAGYHVTWILWRPRIERGKKKKKKKKRRQRSEQTKVVGCRAWLYCPGHLLAKKEAFVL